MLSGCHVLSHLNPTKTLGSENYDNPHFTGERAGGGDKWLVQGHKTAKRWSGNLNLVHLILTYFPKLCYLDFHVADKSLKNTF